MNHLIITNATVATLGEKNQVLENHAVAIKNGIIDKIVPTKELTAASKKGAKIINARGKLLLPGFINAHTHFYSSFACGLNKAAKSKTFVEILNNLWWRLDKKLTLEDSYYSAFVALLTAIRHGTTTIIDHHASPHAVRDSLFRIAAAAGETKLRACLCYEVSDRDGEKIAAEGIAENVVFLKHCQKEKSDKLAALFGLHASFTLSDKTLEKCVQAAREFNTGFHIHTAEAKSDQETTFAEHKKTVVRRLNDLEILGPKTITAHAVHVDAGEIELLQKTDTCVVHNPQSNMNNAVGIADIVTMQGRGVLVGLGTDAMTNNMREELRFCLWAQHLRTQDASVGFMEAIQALFYNNAKIAARLWPGLKIGAIAKGYQADLVLIDYKPATPLTGDSLFGHLIFGVPHAAVDTTIVGGEILMQNQQIMLDLDEAKIYAEAQKLAEKFWQRF